MIEGPPRLGVVRGQEEKADSLDENDAGGIAQALKG
jgi:hypothetical protein